MTQKTDTGRRRSFGGHLQLGALLGVLAACSSSSISNGDDFQRPGASNGANGSGGTGGSGSVTPSVPLVDSRVVRLSHSQYSSTVRDLFGIDESPDSTFAPDALNGFGFDTSSDLRVDPRLGPQYRNAAEELAERAVTDEAVFDRVVTCDAADAGCASEFVASFGERAFRRPLTQAEKTRLEALFTEGSDLGDTGNAFRDGVQLVVEAMLQSPQFLYRTEVSDGAVQNGRETLDDWEIASRLSYLIYDSMPDDVLFQKARAGQLRTAAQVSAEVTRMLDDGRASDKLVSFHEQVWQFGRYSKISPDAETYPNMPADLSERLRGASSRFMASVIEDGGGLHELLTAPYAYADSALAPLYGQSVTGNALSRVDFADGERKGFMMQAGFLASNSYSIKTDPIHRGLFVLRDMLCRVIPDPPPGAAQTPPPESPVPIETTRQEVSLLTGQLYCPTCHSQINEPGFAFEGFDAVGRTRERENGVEVDTSGSITLDGQPIQFEGASELVDALADSTEARDCYTRRFLEFAYGRPLGAGEQALRDTLAAQPRGVLDIVTSLATSPEFMSHEISEEAR
jgi:Protein of unknown function (DUF1592)/Protein of unknown function (DUF1588)/Protein of unknown function (DUF1595)/Protein of unknown function (DUF1587)/Protein of unknown function (DUF1585)